MGGTLPGVVGRGVRNEKTLDTQTKPVHRVGGQNGECELNYFTTTWANYCERNITYNTWKGGELVVASPNMTWRESAIVRIMLATL